MPCTEAWPRWSWALAGWLCLLLAACTLPTAQSPARQETTASPAPLEPPGPTLLPELAVPAPLPPLPATAASAAAQTPATMLQPTPAAPRAPRYVKLAPPATPRTEDELRLQMAERLVAAHPDTSYTTPAPDRLLAIPVLEIELNADGSVRHVRVVRQPTTGDEATLLAIAAVHRAAPYGNVSRLPKPWKVVETFLFDDELHFKPRTLDR